MKKFSMGMMLSGLLVIQIGCGEEAPVNVPVTTPAVDPGTMMHDASKGAAHDAADATKDAADATKDAAAATEDAADATKDAADASKEVAP